MTTIVVLASQPALAKAIQSALHAEHYRVVYQKEVWQAEPLLRRGMAEVCILDADLPNLHLIERIETIKRMASDCPILVYAGSLGDKGWEEKIYLAGASYVLEKPVRSDLLAILLDRVTSARPTSSPTRTAPSNGFGSAGEANPSGQVGRESVRMLKALRRFSSILTHSLCSTALLNEFLSLLREVIGVNRAAIFLRDWKNPGAGLREGMQGRHLVAACALGLPLELLQHFQLTLEAGIGRHVHRSGRILMRDSDEGQQDAEVQKELEVLGAQVAVPILDRESLVGVAVFDRPLTNDGYSSEELALIFHLLEHLGLAVKNSWLYDQLSTGHQQMTAILDHIRSACVVIGRDLTVIHGNRRAYEEFGLSEGATRNLELSDLPKELGSRAFEVLQGNEPISGFRFHPPRSPNRTLRAGIVPFRQGDAPSQTEQAVLVVVDDVTEEERSRKVEMEASNLRLTRAMAARIAHEIGNSMVPIAAFQQTSEATNESPSSILTLQEESGFAITRIFRLLQQMRFLAQGELSRKETVRVDTLLREAFDEAKGKQGDEGAGLETALPPRNPEPSVQADRDSLKHAFLEIFLNALEANPTGGAIDVKIEELAPIEGGEETLRVIVRDKGPGFSAEEAQRAFEPFFTIRYQGLGLGLTVAKKVIDLHQGAVEILQSEAGPNGAVAVSLPAGRC